MKDRRGLQIKLDAGLWLCFSLAAAAWPQQVVAWGDMGHEIVCEIAFRELEESARERVKELIRLDPEFRYFSDACVWPDHPRQRAEEHYINVSRSYSTHHPDCREADRCLLSAIRDDRRILADPNAGEAQQLAALKFLGHWVGDIHQPLHVAFQDDRGGNLIRGDGPRELSLHRVWDSEIIASGLRGTSRQVASDLHRAISERDRAAWARSSPLDWAKESYRIAISPSVGYCIRKANACWYGAQSLHYQQGTRTMRIDRHYLAEHLGTVTRRLKMAGVRLARVLEEAL